jgi:photosystem II stability/assembly factor-like uncharacterized protein
MSACGRLPVAESSPSPPPSQSPAPSAGPTPAATPYATSRPPANIFIWDADLVDALAGWILIAPACSLPDATACQYQVARTVDGGMTWSHPVAVGPVYSATDGDAPRFVRFLNRSDGFVYGHSDAFVTHDGGLHWSGAGLPAGEVVAIAGRGIGAWAVTRDCAKGVVCPYTVRASADGGRTWTAHQLPNDISPLDAIPFGDSGLLASTFSDIAVTADGGTTWQRVRSACGVTETFRNFVATVDGNELWQLCEGLVAGVPSDHTLYVSENQGASWSLVKPSPARLPANGTLETLISTARGTALITSDSDPIFVTRDLGVTWTQVAPPTTVRSEALAFPSVRLDGNGNGWARDFNQIVWTSHDNGMTWTPLPAYVPVPAGPA